MTNIARHVFMSNYLNNVIWQNWTSSFFNMSYHIFMSNYLNNVIWQNWTRSFFNITFLCQITYLNNVIWQTWTHALICSITFLSRTTFFDKPWLNQAWTQLDPAGLQLWFVNDVTFLLGVGYIRPNPDDRINKNRRTEFLWP